MHVIKTSFNPTDNSIVYVCNDDSVFTFIRDRSSSRVMCQVMRANMTIIRQCLVNYEALDVTEIDKIGVLFN